MMIPLPKADYEPFPPEEVGWERRLVMGKHSGRHMVTKLLQQQGISLSPEDTQSVLDAVRQHSVQNKRNLDMQELLSLVTSLR